MKGKRRRKQENVGRKMIAQNVLYNPAQGLEAPYKIHNQSTARTSTTTNQGNLTPAPKRTTIAMVAVVFDWWHYHSSHRRTRGRFGGPRRRVRFARAWVTLVPTLPPEEHDTQPGPKLTSSSLNIFGTTLEPVLLFSASRERWPQLEKAEKCSRRVVVSCIARHSHRTASCVSKSH